VFGEERRLVETFRLASDGGIVLTESVAAVFVDLTLAGRALKKPVEAMTAAEMWAIFLAKADRPKHGKVVGEIIKRREGISVADAMLRTISQDEYERARFHSRRHAPALPARPVALPARAVTRPCSSRPRTFH
jgi:hypothetical protein